MTGKIFTLNSKDSQQQLVEDLSSGYKDINKAEHQDSMMSGFNYSNSENQLEKESDDWENSSQQELSVWKKVCFAMAGLTYQMYFCAVSVFAVVFLLNSAKLPPLKNTYILFISRIMDAITDVIYAYFVEKSPITRYGKMKPWIFWSTPLSAISYVMMWYIPSNFSENQLFIWFLVWHTAFFTFMTGVRIPHTAMTMYLCSSLKERELATIYRMGFEMIGLLLALVIQGPFLSGSSECTNTTIPINVSLSNQSDLGYANVYAGATTESFWQKNIYFMLALVLTCIFLVGNYLLIFFVKEKEELLTAIDKKSANTVKMSTATELKRILTFRPYIILGCATILNTSAVQVVQANMELYFKYSYTALANLFSLVILILLGCAVLFVPFWKIFMQKIDKKYLFMIGNLTMVPLLFGGFFFGSGTTLEIVIFFLLSIMAANCFTSVFLIPWSMLPEVLDAYFIVYKTKPDAFFYTFFNLGSKVIMALYFGVTQIVLELVNYKANACTQAPGVKSAILYLFSPTSMTLLLLSCIFVLMHPISSQKAVENSKLIIELNKFEYI